MTPRRSGLFRTKSLDVLVGDAERGEGHLRRALGPWNVVLLGVGAIVGAGIFATIGTAAAGDAHRPGAGPSLVLSFVITAFVCGLTALCYAEMASMVPVAGSAYTYAYATLGELVAWIIGWDLIIEYAVGNVAVAISWANYARTFLDELGIHVPLWAATDYRTALRSRGSWRERRTSSGSRSSSTSWPSRSSPPSRRSWSGGSGSRPLSTRRW